MSATTTETAQPAKAYRPHSAQLKGMAEHLGQARLLFDLGMTHHALAEVQLVQVQLNYLAGVEAAVEKMEARS